MKDYTFFWNPDKYNFVTDYKVITHQDDRQVITHQEEEPKKKKTKDVVVSYAKGSDMVITLKRDTLSHINDLMAKQYELFSGNVNKFKLCKNAWIGEMVPFVLGGVGDVALYTNGADIKMVTALGVVCLGGVVLGALGVKRNNDKIQEIEKVKYRDENIATLVTYPKYDNSLRGVRSEAHFENYRNKPEKAFDFIYLDKFSRADLEKIVRNIHQEKVLLGLEPSEYEIEKRSNNKSK